MTTPLAIYQDRRGRLTRAACVICCPHSQAVFPTQINLSPILPLIIDTWGVHCRCKKHCSHRTAHVYSQTLGQLRFAKSTYYVVSMKLKISRSYLCRHEFWFYGLGLQGLTCCMIMISNSVLSMLVKLLQTGTSSVMIDEHHS